MVSRETMRSNAFGTIKKDLCHIRIVSPGPMAFLFDVILKCVCPGGNHGQII